jgi:hypothetical protein
MQMARLILISITLCVAASVHGLARCHAEPGASDGSTNDPVSGLYEGVAKMPAGSKDINFIVEIKNANGTLSGHIETEQAQFPITGSFGGGGVTIKFNPGSELTITAKVAGDQISGEWVMDGGRSGAIQMKRVSVGWKEVHDIVARARKDMNQFTKAGGKAANENSPARKWADQLLDYSRAHPGASEAKDAENEGLLLLLRSGLIAEAATRAATQAAPEDAWKRAVTDQLATASGENDHDYAIRYAEALIEHSKRPELKAQIRLAQGDAFWDKGDPAQARAVFRRVMDESPKTRFAEEAKGDIYEIEKLNVGQAAPELDSQFVDGHQARLADYKGKTVLLVFWASW